MTAKWKVKKGNWTFVRFIGYDKEFEDLLYSSTDIDLSEILPENKLYEELDNVRGGIYHKKSVRHLRVEHYNNKLH